jgi:hypothetical protein
MADGIPVRKYTGLALSQVGALLDLSPVFLSQRRPMTKSCGYIATFSTRCYQALVDFADWFVDRLFVVTDEGVP